MSVKRFKFVSPGVFVNEIDNSQLPALTNAVGPVIVGRTERGPAMRPVTVRSQSEFVEMFGNPVPGGLSGDVWREGNRQSPTYASYAAMAYLRNNGPVTMVRLLGHEHESAADAGKAGWDVSGDAYGLFLYDSGTAGSPSTPITGTLAAIFYMNAGHIVLSGTRHAPGSAAVLTSSAYVGIESVGANREFKAIIYGDDTLTGYANTDGTGTEIMTTFNFDKNSDKYIRKVFNTNPALVSSDNSIATENQQKYWLGQTFEDSISDHLVSSSAGDVIGIIANLTDGTKNQKSFRSPSKHGSTGWVFSQQLDGGSGSYDVGGASLIGASKLFKFHALDCGEWESSNLKVSIEDIRYSRNEGENPFGSFTVTVRKRQDNDSAVKYVERFAGCNLNPMSPNYVKRKLGDQELSWDEGEARYKVVGDYPNQSKFIRVEVNPDIDNASMDPRLVPFGFQGPRKIKDIVCNSANGLRNRDQLVAGNSQGANTFISIPDPKPHHAGLYADTTDKSHYNFGHRELLLKFPSLPTRANTSAGMLPSRQAAYWGVDSTATSGSGLNDSMAGWCDLVYPQPDSISDSTSYTELMFHTSLDEVVLSDGVCTHTSGSRAAGTSLSATNDYKKVLDEGIDKLTLPLFGGFDGLDIRTLDPFAPDLQIASDATEKTSYEFYSIKKAINTCSDPEVVECNLMAVPGITSNAVNQHLVNVSEQRADCLAVLDIKGGYKPRANRQASEDTFAEYGGTVTETLSNLKDLGINSSYACTYYPWVQITDTGQNASLWVPPSVVALGTMGSSASRSELWFAPAGFTRGGLTQGSAGFPVTAVRDRLTSKQRDELYQQQVNPIATFPAEGIVIFGQKTMQVTPSALDRINVRRLMIFVKKEISRMAATTLFDQNVRSTWNRFLGRVNPFLRSVKARLGLTDFKVILDETTTTPELVDRNIMYAKILLKPARSIEYIAVDFVITNSGASFED